ncbi:MAG: hypothetical protein D6694_13560 [Gammaproteobacteria bacterium]|nr:MAG: hypothetical protein D6694_13560 [Gammaproteobacteria bacterium]
MKKQRIITIILSIIFSFVPILITINTIAKAAPNTDNTGCHFGNSVDTAGDVNGDGYDDVIVAASGCEAVYVYYGSATGLSALPDWSYVSDQSGAQFGVSVSTAGDVNSDGYDDIIVGAFRYNAGLGDRQGKAFVFYGSESGLSATPDWTMASDQSMSQFGYSVGTAGDVNGDGYDDVIIGAPFWADSRVFIYPGSATGLSTRVWTLNEADYTAFGSGVSTAGDVNNDGFDDVIVGAYQYGYPSMRGAAFVYYGSADGVVTTPAWSTVGDQIDARYGFHVAAMGDVNNDGYDDIVLEEPMYDDGANENAGRIHAFYGSATGPSPTADWILVGEQAGMYLGATSSAGDVNNDGFDDLIVGDFYDPSVSLDGAGRARIYFGSATGLSTTANWTVVGGQADEMLGIAVGLAGDVDGNDYVDIIVGAYHYDGTYRDEGRAYAYCGTVEGLSTTPCWTGGLSETIYSNSIYLPLVLKGQ